MFWNMFWKWKQFRINCFNVWFYMSCNLCWRWFFYKQLARKSLFPQCWRTGTCFWVKFEIHQKFWWQWRWWQQYVGDFMTVTDLRCWWQNHYVGDFFRYLSDCFNVFNRSPISWTCHQHILSPTSVTNIDVTEIFFWNFRSETLPIRFSKVTVNYFKLWQRILIHNNFDRGVPSSSRWIFKGFRIHFKSRRSRISPSCHHDMFNNISSRDRFHDKEFWCSCFHNFDDREDNPTSPTELFCVWCSLRSLGLGWNWNRFLWPHSKTTSQMLPILQKLEK